MIVLIVIIIIMIIIAIYLFKSNTVTSTNTNINSIQQGSIIRFMLDKEPKDPNSFKIMNKELKNKNGQYDYVIVNPNDINDNIKSFNKQYNNHIKVLTLSLMCAKYFNVEHVKHFKGIIMATHEFQVRQQNVNNKIVIQVLEKDHVSDFNDLTEKYNINKLFQMSSVQDIPNMKEMVTSISNRDIEIYDVDSLDKYRKSERVGTFIIMPVGQDTTYKYYNIIVTIILYEPKINSI